MIITMGRGSAARSIEIATGHDYCKRTREDRTSFVNTMCGLLGIAGRKE
jgi:hypothetical protein